MSHIAYVNGRYVPHADAMVHIEDRGFQFADGIYEVAYIYNGMPVDHKDHLKRLRRSMSELRMTPPCSDAALTIIMKEVVRRNRIVRGIVYTQVNRGVAPRNHPFPGAHVKPSLIMTAKSGAGPSDAAFEQGVKVITAPDIRWGRRDIKTVGLLPNAMAKQAAAEAKAQEALLHRPDGSVTEASASNAWIVTADKTLVTHPATNDILSGITRNTVMKLARAAGYKIEERAFTLDEAFKAKEVFLTGTTSFVLPVVRIDDRSVANGSPGTVAVELRQLYRAYLENLTPDTAWDV